MVMEASITHPNHEIINIVRDSSWADHSSSDDDTINNVPNQSTISAMGSFPGQKTVAKAITPHAKQSNSSNYVLHSSVFLLVLFTTSTSLFISGVPPSKLPAFILYMFCTRLVIPVIVNCLVFLIDKLFFTRLNQILFFVYALRTSVVYLFWFGSIYLSWGLLFESEKGANLIRWVMSTLATCVVGTGLWIVKIVVLKLIDFDLHDNEIFQDIQHLASQQYLLQNLLLGLRTKGSGSNGIRAKLEYWMRAVAVGMLHGLSRVSIICNALENTNESLREKEVEDIAPQIFEICKKNKFSAREINEADLQLVVNEEDVTKVFLLLGGANERKCISEASLRNWAAKVYKEGKTLRHLLSQTDKKLNYIVSAVVLFLTSLAWFFLMDFATKGELLFVLTVMLFIFRETCKEVTSGMIFVFVQRVFSVGDRCVIDGKQMVVARMGILLTVFLGENNEELYSQNSYLVTKTIVNYNGSSEMRDIMEVMVDGSTSDVTIAALELKIAQFLGNNPKDWHPKHRLHLYEIEDKMLKYRLHVTHTSSFENSEEINSRRSQLLSELRRGFQGRVVIEIHSARFLT